MDKRGDIFCPQFDFVLVSYSALWFPQLRLIRPICRPKGQPTNFSGRFKFGLGVASSKFVGLKSLRTLALTNIFRIPFLLVVGGNVFIPAKRKTMVRQTTKLWWDSTLFSFLLVIEQTMKEMLHKKGLTWLRFELSKCRRRREVLQARVVSMNLHRKRCSLT